MKNIFLGAVLIVLTYLLCEGMLRLVLYGLGYPFVKPGNILVKKYYPEVAEIMTKVASSDRDSKKVLILGGSVISSGWSRMESRLDTLLPVSYGKAYHYEVYNAAIAGHTSLDNMIKYQLLQSLDFDLVLYYEAINENRANNIPYHDFRKDYSHIRWYDEIQQIKRHREMNVTVIPYVLDLVFHTVIRIVRKKPYLEFERVNPAYVLYGDSIQTAASYESHLTGIIHLAKKKKERLLLVRYASFFPENVVLTGEEEDMIFFAGCTFACPVTIWGKAGNVKKGIDTHNAVLAKLAEKNNIDYLDPDIPQDAAYFCDVCHVSEAGAVLFATRLSDFIAENKLLDAPYITHHKTPAAIRQDH